MNRETDRQINGWMDAWLVGWIEITHKSIKTEFKSVAFVALHDHFHRDLGHCKYIPQLQTSTALT